MIKEKKTRKTYIYFYNENEIDCENVKFERKSYNWNYSFICG